MGAPAFAYYDQAETAGLTYEELATLIQDRQLTTIEDTLANLKQQKPQFFDNVALMYRSKSLQRGSFLAPRALLFDRSGQMVITFNGDPEDRIGYQKLEIVQFRPETNRFEFREIGFTPGQTPKFSDANPAKCLQCHQSSDRKNIDPRPNWEPYNNWPGAYGSHGGGLSRLQSFDINRLEKQDAQHIADQALEGQMLRKFMREVKPNHPRYKYLGFTDLPLEPAVTASYEEKAKEVRAYDHLAHGTVDLTEFLGQLNARRIMRIMKEEWAGQWEYLKYSVAGIAQCRILYMSSGDYTWAEEHLPNEFIIRPDSPYALDDNYSARLTKFRADLRTQGLSSAEIDKLEVDERVRISNEPTYLRYLPSKAIWTLFEPLGISIRDWSLDFQTQGRMAFYERFGLPSNFQDALSRAFKIVNPEMSGNTCEELEALSIEKMAEYKKTVLFQQTLQERLALEANRKPLIERCISCHAGGTEDFGAPPIPFNNESQLRIALARVNSKGQNLLEEIKYRVSDHATLDEQMPRGLGRPTRDERNTLVSYLEKVAAGN